MADAAPAKPDELTHELLSRGLCVAEGGLVLLCRLKKSPERSFLPGGHVDPGEGARAALEREFREELALPSRAGAFLGAAEHFFGPEGGKTFEMNVVFALECPDAAASAPEPPRSAEPWQEFFWWPLADLAGAGFEPACLRGVLPAWASASRSGGAAGAGFASAYENPARRDGR